MKKASLNQIVSEKFVFQKSPCRPEEQKGADEVNGRLNGDPVLAYVSAHTREEESERCDGVDYTSEKDRVGAESEGK